MKCTCNVNGFSLLIKCTVKSRFNEKCHFDSINLDFIELDWPRIIRLLLLGWSVGLFSAPSNLQLFQILMQSPYFYEFLPDSVDCVQVWLGDGVSPPDLLRRGAKIQAHFGQRVAQLSGRRWWWWWWFTPRLRHAFIQGGLDWDSSASCWA